MQGFDFASNRACTDFLIQNLRLFQTFFQNNNLFFQAQGYPIGDE